MGMNFLVNALSAGPLEAMIALNVILSAFDLGYLPDIAYMFTSAPEIV